MQSHSVHGNPSLIGQKFGRLTVTARGPKGSRTMPRQWVCTCDCGTIVAVITRSLRSGNTKSCGCWNREATRLRSTKHGMARRGQAVPEFIIWKGIKQRTGNTHAGAYSNYGGRGIAMCKRWRESFAAFYTDMGPRPSPKYSTDRRDNEGHYSCGTCEECLSNGWPANCSWATRSQQNSHTRRSRLLTHHGETKSIPEWARSLGMSINTIRARLFHGMSVDRILATSDHRRSPMTRLQHAGRSVPR